MIIHSDDGRYAHVPRCNKRCGGDGHYLEQSVSAPWQVQHDPECRDPGCQVCKDVTGPLVDWEPIKDQES